MNHSIRRTLLVGSLILTIGAASAAEPPMRVLFIGNSLLSIMPAYPFIPTDVSDLASSLGVPFVADAVANGGWDLSQHANNFPTTNAINSGVYNLVVLQELSTYASQPSVRVSKMFPACRTLNTLITNKNQKTMFYESWGWVNGDSSSCSSYDIPEQYKTCGSYFGAFTAMNIATRQGYTMIADELGAPIAPVGIAWGRVRNERPDLNLYAGDDRHPNTLSAYLAACVFYSAIFGRSPEKSTFYSAVNVPDAHYIQRIAAETVLNDPFASDAWGFGSSHYLWAFAWENYTNAASTAEEIIISGASATPSPSVLVAADAGSVGSLTLGILHTNYNTYGEGRLYVRPGGSIVATNVMTVGREGSGYVKQNGGAVTIQGALTLGEQPGGFGQFVLSNGVLNAASIDIGQGEGSFQFRGGQLTFGSFGNAARPLSLTNGGNLVLTNTSGTATINGDYTGRTNSTTSIEIGSATPALNISGAAALGGTLQLSCAPGFLPGLGKQITLLSAASIDGQFSTIPRALVGTNGWGFVVSVTATSVLATVSNVIVPTASITRLPNGTFQYVVENTHGSSYILQTSTNLTDWTPVQTNIPSLGVTVPTTLAPCRFYRAILNRE